MDGEIEPGALHQAQDDEKHFQKEEEALLLETGDGEFLDQRQLRMTKNDKVEMEFREEIKQKTNLAASTVKKLVEKVFGLVIEKESVIDAREDVIARYKELVDHQKAKIVQAQIFSENVIETSENGSIVDNNSEQNDMSKFLVENDIASVDELQNKLIELDKLQREIKMHRDFFQARQTRQMGRNVQQADSNQFANLQRRIAELESENRKLKAFSNEKSLIPQCLVDTEKREKESEKFSVNSEVPESREVVRDARLNNTMNENLVNENGDIAAGDFLPNGIQPKYRQSDSSSSNTKYWDNDGQWEKVRQETKPHYHTLFDTGVSPEMQMIALMQQMQTESRLPDPPKYTAEEHSTSMEAFKKTFLMKYGRLTQDQQVTLLEANFLGGKALKTFKGIPDAEKKSFYSLMNIMADRLRVSREDDSRRAKSNWEQLQRKPSQSVEDFCLVIDEKARRAFARMDPRELSSLKSQKLLDAIVDDATMSSLIGVKLHDIPEEDHYEFGREMAIRYERCLKDRERSKKKDTESEKKEGKFVHGDSGGHQQNQSQAKKPFHPKQNQSRNYQQQFNSPSHNYQANPGNNNYQFSSSHDSPQIPSMTKELPNQNQVSQHNQSLSENQLPIQDQQPQKFMGFPSCEECHQTGCHETNCSKAPKTSKSVTCWKCQAPGHYANNCPNGYNSSNQPPTLPQKNFPSVSTIDYQKNDVNEVATSESLQYEDGRIAGVDVTLLIDSGSSISLMSRTMWNDIVRLKGKQWERGILKETSKISHAITANNQIMNILFQVELETAMGSRTRKIPICVADIHRDTVILGVNNFDVMGIQLVVDRNSDDSKARSSDSECPETEDVPNSSSKWNSKKKLEDYRSVTSVLYEEDKNAVSEGSKEEAVKGSTVDALDYIEESAKGAAEDSRCMLCCEDHTSDREQRSYTEYTHVKEENIGVCVKHTDAEDPVKVLCCETGTSESDQIVCSRKTQVIDKQQSLQKKNKVTKVTTSFEGLKKIHQKSLQKAGLQKQEDVAGRGTFQVKTRCRPKEKFQLKKDSPLHPTKSMSNPYPVCHMLSTRHSRVAVTNLKDPPDSLYGHNVSSSRVKEEPRPRKDPPVQGHQELPHVNQCMSQESTVTGFNPIQ